MLNCDFNKVEKQLYWNHISAWLCSFKFAVYFQNNFSYEHLLVTTFQLIFTSSKSAIEKLNKKWNDCMFLSYHVRDSDWIHTL